MESCVYRELDVELRKQVTEERNAFALGCYWFCIMGCKSPGVQLLVLVGPVVGAGS